MKIRHAFVALAFLAAAATSFSAKPESAGPDPDAMLKSLYKAHDAQQGPFFNKDNRKLINQYFTRELTGLIMKDAKQAKDEIGALDFDPLYDSQDPQITNFKVGKVNWGGILKREDDEPEEGLAVVDVTFKDGGKTRRIGFRFHQTAKKTWKIADINYPNGRSIVGILRGDGAGPNGGNVAKADPE